MSTSTDRPPVLLLPHDRPIPPFNDSAPDVQILGRSLRAIQEEAVAEAGLELVAEAPTDRAYLVVSGRTWVTGGALRRFVQQASAPARLRVEHTLWLEHTHALQELEAPGVYEVALLPAGAPPDFAAAPPVTIELDFDEERPPRQHPAMAFAAPDVIPVSDAGVHQIDHWSHILRVNWLAMAATISREKRGFMALNIVVKAWRILKLLLKVRSLNPFKLAGGLNQWGKGCKIHPTAVVEACVMGDNVEVGPHAVLRGAVIGSGVVIEEFGIVNASVLGDGAKVGRRGTANLCVLYPGAMISCGNGFQASVFGRDSFVAWSVTIFDLSFKGPVKVMRDGQRVSAGVPFLGAAIGHRAKLGGKVRIGYGAEVPNDAFVVGDSHDVLRSWRQGPGPHRVLDGQASPLGLAQEPESQ